MTSKRGKGTNLCSLSNRLGQQRTGPLMGEIEGSRPNGRYILLKDNEKYTENRMS